MALLTKAGKIEVPSSTGLQTVTGCGFRPKALVFFSGSTDDGFDDGSGGMYTLATSPTDVRHSHWHRWDSSTRDGYSESDVINLIAYDGFNDRRARASLAAITDDGFTLDWSSIDSGYPWIHEKDIHFIALGGDGVRNATLSTIEPSGNRGSQAITGLGFQPNTILFLPNRGWDMAKAGYMQGFGVATPKGEWSRTWQNGVSSSLDTSSRYNPYQSLMLASGSSYYGRANVASFDADGFTIDWLDTPITS